MTSDLEKVIFPLNVLELETFNTLQFHFEILTILREVSCGGRGRVNDARSKKKDPVFKVNVLKLSRIKMLHFFLEF